MFDLPISMNELLDRLAKLGRGGPGRRRSNYDPHQGKREILRRRRYEALLGSTTRLEQGVNTTAGFTDPEYAGAGLTEAKASHQLPT